MPLFTAGLALTVGGTLMQASAQRRQSAYAAQQARIDADAQAEALLYNAELAKMNSDEAVRVAHENKRLGLSSVRRQIGTSAARTAARGVSVGSATAQDLQYEVALRGEYQINESFRAQMAEAHGFSGQALMGESQARFARIRGKHQARVTRMEGTAASRATMLTGGTNVAMMVDNHMQAGGTGPYAPIAE